METAKFINNQLTEGIVFVDKPTGVSSHRVVNWARRCSGIRKVGHTGTLDPLATGLLIILVGRKFTKLQDTFLKQDKDYVCMAKLGLQTDSYDIDGEVLDEKSWEEVQTVSKEAVTEALDSQQGKIQQKVPIFSAVKQSGRKLYEIARKAKYDEQAKQEMEEVLENLPEREVEIYQIELLKFAKNTDTKEVTFSFSVSCSSGTYVRSITHDVGKILGVGATVTQLRRTKIGDFSIEHAQVCPLF